MHKQPSLLTIPPELLLQIISHLPKSASFLPLIQTCTGLKAFFTQHAAQICNTRVTLHYPLSSALLSSTFIQGADGQNWLTPTVPAIRSGEGEVWRRCKRNKEERCKIREWRQRTRLSVPGPQFLRFLECYEREIKIRIAMEVEGLENLDVGVIVERAKKTGAVERAIGMYCVIGFVVKMSEFVEEFVERDDGKGILQREMPKRLGEALKEKFAHFRKQAQKMKGKQISPMREKLLFGEIVRVPDPKAEIEKDNFAKGVLWYYGRSGICPLETQAPKSRKASHLLFWKLEVKTDKK